MKLLSSLLALILLQTTFVSTAEALNIRDIPKVKVSSSSSSKSSDPAKELKQFIMNQATFLHPKTWKTYDLKVGTYVAVHNERSSIHIFTEKNTSKLDMTGLDRFFMQKVTLSENGAGSIATDWYIPSFHLLAKTETTLMGKPALQYEYTGERQSKPFYGKSILTYVENTVYWISMYSADAQTFAKDEATFVQVAASLRSASASSSSRPKGPKLKSSSSASTKVLLKSKKPNREALRGNR